MPGSGKALSGHKRRIGLAPDFIGDRMQLGRGALAHHCGSACKRDPGSGVIGVKKGPLILVV